MKQHTPTFQMGKPTSVQKTSYTDTSCHPLRVLLDPEGHMQVPHHF